jgi:hypothetical protein
LNEKEDNMKNWQITGLLAILIIGTLLMSGCTKNAGSPVAISTPPSVLTTEVTPHPTPVQVAIPQTGVWLRVIYPGNYAGTYGLPEYQTPVEDTGEHFYQIATVKGPVVASITKQDGTGDKLVVTVYKDGVLFKEESTTIPYRSIEFYSDIKTPTPITYNTSTPVVPVTPSMFMLNNSVI